MSIRVIDRPEPLLAPSDVPGDHAGDDHNVAGLIASATEEFDGPNGLLQRSIGPQTLELTVGRAMLDGCDAGDYRLPLPPLIAVEAVVAVSEDGVETILDPAGYVVRGIGTDDGRLRLRDAWPSSAEELRIRFRAGYDGDVTPSVPSRVKTAVLLSVQNYQAGADVTGGTRSFQVDGAFTESFNSPEQAQRTRNATISGLVAPLRIFR